MCRALRVRRLVLVQIAHGVVVDAEDVSRQGQERVRREVVDARALHRHVTGRLDVDACEQRA